MFAGEKNNMWDLGSQLLCVITEDIWWVLFWSILWEIWLKRNAWIFSKKKIGIIDVVCKVVGLVNNYENANEKHQHGLNNTQLIRV